MSMMRTGLCSLAWAGIVALSALAMEGPRHEPPPREPPPDDALVRRVEERVEMLRKWRVLEALDPSEELANRLLPLLSAADRVERDLMRRREETTAELRAVLEHDGRNEARLKELLAALDQCERERCRAQERRDQELAQLLTVRQRARLVITLEDFHREVRELIARVRRPPPDRMGEPPVQ